MRAGAWRLWLLAGVVLVLGSSAAVGETLVGKGRDIAMTRCGACHSLARSGASPHRDAPPLRDIARRYPVAGLAEAFAEGITVGHKDMPEFILEPPEIDALLAFMETLGR